MAACMIQKRRHLEGNARGVPGIADAGSDDNTVALVEIHPSTNHKARSKARPVWVLGTLLRTRCIMLLGRDAASSTRSAENLDRRRLFVLSTRIVLKTRLVCLWSRISGMYRLTNGRLLCTYTGVRACRSKTTCNSAAAPSNGGPEAANYAAWLAEDRMRTEILGLSISCLHGHYSSCSTTHFITIR
ncbi:uncharacterized protein B0I36DRAFT_109848 [Microdochium trichocladiopsis]|uniref:Uncharacterized protein n=1 Tax=Microdochium trichocladiopsis TaxID=1682393 RepID=A0A9P8Y9C9_9PEZI|nr:uncharacterized protein B0I36DRAFT_109848 [Microdochium trichocladiopsis]KAH7033497.1 hypothetical protein B0I36DRAFT_109848 [Microdochium trichocladiopsis]